MGAILWEIESGWCVLSMPVGVVIADTQWSTTREGGEGGEAKGKRRGREDGRKGEKERERSNG